DFGAGYRLRGGAEWRRRSAEHFRSSSRVTAGGDMTDRTIELDKHRGMAAQKATELRRLVGEVAADRARLKERQDELEKFLAAAPAATWPDAVDKARYLISLFAATSEAQDTRRKTLIAGLLD